MVRPSGCGHCDHGPCDAHQNCGGAEEEGEEEEDASAADAGVLHHGAEDCEHDEAQDRCADQEQEPP